jgi:hypothetical protein
MGAMISDNRRFYGLECKEENMKYFFRILFLPLFILSVVFVILGVLLFLLYAVISKFDFGFDEDYGG